MADSLTAHFIGVFFGPNQAKIHGKLKPGLLLQLLRMLLLFPKRIATAGQREESNALL